MEDIDLTGLMVTQDNIEDEPEVPEYDYDEPVDFGPPPPPMFSAERQKKIMLINKWINTFPNELNTFRKKDLESMSDAELDSLRDELDYNVRSGGDCDIGVSAMQGIIAGAEKVCVDYDLLKIQGLSEICKDPQVIRDMKYISLKHFGSVDIAPEARLSIKIVGTAMMLHNVNTEKAAKMAKINPEKVANLEQKYNDL